MSQDALTTDISRGLQYELEGTEHCQFNWAHVAGMPCAPMDHHFHCVADRAAPHALRRIEHWNDGNVEIIGFDPLDKVRADRASSAVNVTLRCRSERRRRMGPIMQRVKA